MATFSWVKYPFSRATHRSAYSTLGTQPKARMRSRGSKDLQEVRKGSEAASAAALRRKLLRLLWDNGAPSGMCCIEFNMTGLSFGIVCNLKAGGAGSERELFPCCAVWWIYARFVASLSGTALGMTKRGVECCVSHSSQSTA